MRSVFCEIGAALVVAIGVLAGCSKGVPGPDIFATDVGPGDGYTAIVTVKQSENGAVYFQLNEDKRLYPQNYEYPFTGLRRIICGLQETGGDSCRVLWMEFLEQGSKDHYYVPVAAPEDGPEDPFPEDGPEDSFPHDGLDILEDWMTGAEDGFLTLHYSTWWGDGSVAHRLRLVYGTHPGNPYELLLSHDRNNDAFLEKADALICFDINDLPSTEGKYVNLRLKWTDSEGKPAAKDFYFKSRTQ